MMPFLKSLELLALKKEWHNDLLKLSSINQHTYFNPMLGHCSMSWDTSEANDEDACLTAVYILPKEFS
jgi:hypothetical protein